MTESWRHRLSQEEQEELAYIERVIDGLKTDIAACRAKRRTYFEKGRKRLERAIDKQHAGA